MLLLVVAVVSTRLGASVGMAAGLGRAGVVILVFGMAQVNILPGDNHWIIRVLHLLVGIAAVGMSRSGRAVEFVAQRLAGAA